MKKLNTAVLALCVTLGTAPLAGQSAANQQAADAQDKTTFRVRVDLVTTDVIPRDSEGRFVPDLSKNDFEIYEDGVKQDLSSLTVVSGGRVTNALVPPPPPSAEGLILPQTRVQDDTSGRIFIFFIDDLHIRVHDSTKVINLLDRAARSLLHEGDLFGVVSTGVSSIAVDLTYDRRRLSEAAKKVHGSLMSPGEIIQAQSGLEGPVELRYNAHQAFKTASDVFKNLEKVHNRRKAIVYLSTGYDLTPLQGSRLTGNQYSNFTQNETKVLVNSATADPENSSASQNRPDPNAVHPGEEFSEADLARELNDLTRIANEANATIYTIDPRGPAGAVDATEKVNPMELRTYVDRTQSTMRVLATETGGFAVVNNGDFDKAFRRIDDETSNYYVLGYYSNRPDSPGRSHQIEVRVIRPGIAVWSRK